MIFDFQLTIHHRKCQPVILIQQKVLLNILHIKSFSQPADKYHWKFQTFAFVNTHNPYNIFVVTENSRRFQIGMIILHLFKKTQKQKNTFKTGFLIGTSPFMKCTQICLTLHTIS